MDSPSWSDTIRAALHSSCSCLPCFPRSPSLGDSDAENENEYGALGTNATYTARRARADELEGLLADANVSSNGWQDDDGDAAADADAISLHSQLGPRGRRKPPHRTPRHISLFGFSLFGTGKGVTLPEGGADPLHSHAGRRESASTADLLASAASEPGPEALTEEEVERRARRRARKEMRRMAAAVASTESQAQPPDAELEGSQHPRIPAPFLHLPTPPQNVDADGDDDADLDGGAYARRTPRGLSVGGSGTHSRSSGRSSNSGSGPRSPYSPTTATTTAPPIPKTRKSGKRSTRSKSSATSSTLASPPPSASRAAFAVPKSAEEFGPFAEPEGGFDGTPGGFDAFDGTPGGFDSPPFDADAAGGWGAGEVEMHREALPSPGLSRLGDGGRERGLSFGSGASGIRL